MQNIVLPMEELNGNPPFIAIAGALHCVNHLQSNAMLVIDPAQSMGCIAMYIALGESVFKISSCNVSKESPNFLCRNITSVCCLATSEVQQANQGS